MKDAPNSKMRALEELAQAMAKLKLDKLKGYKRTNAVDPMEDLPIDEDHEGLDEPTIPGLEGEDEEEEEDSSKPKGFSQVLEAIARKKAKHH